MRVGVPREVKPDENRVALTPSGAHALVADGHTVVVEAGAGAGSLIHDSEYVSAGADVVEGADEIWNKCDIVVKVKEPQESEFALLREDLILFTFLHLAAYARVAKALGDAHTTAIAYEMVQLEDGSLPLLAPMSEVAGRLAPQVGARFLEKAGGGRGVLLGGVAGVEPGKVVVIGGGVAGSNAARIAMGMGADVAVFDVNPARLRELDQLYEGRLKTRMANPMDVGYAIAQADLVIGAVLVPGARAPRVLSAEDVQTMQTGSVLVDISIDQGGCFETSRETTHSAPVYVIGGVVHYAVGNIPGSVPRTSTFALCNVTLPYLRALATHNVDGAAKRMPELAGAVSIRNGEPVDPIATAAMRTLE